MNYRWLSSAIFILSIRISAMGSLAIDAKLTLEQINEKTYDEIAHMHPCGCKNPEPRYCVSCITLVGEPKLLKELHVKCMVTDGTHRRELIFFNRAALYHHLKQNGTKPFNVVGRLSKNVWRGNTKYEMIAEDISFSENK